MCSIELVGLLKRTPSWRLSSIFLQPFKKQRVFSNYGKFKEKHVAVTLKMKLQISSCSFTKTRLYLGYFSKNLPSFRKNSFRKY